MRRVVVAASVAAVALLAACAPEAGSGSLATPTPSTTTASLQPSAAAPPTPSLPAPTRQLSTSPPERPTAPPHSATHSPRTPVGPSPTTSFPPGTGPVVVLDPGHDGGNETHLAQIDKLVPAGFGRTKPCNTTGTNTNAGYPEHAFTWRVAEQVRTILVAHGVRVIMTRSSDSGVGPCVNVRAAISSTPGVVAAVSIHADGAPSSGHGFHVCYASRRPASATAATMARSKALSVAVHDALRAGSGLVPSTYIGHDGYFPRQDLAGLNLSTAPTTFLELGNMRNAGDAALQSSAAGRHRIAAAVAAGILAYLGRPGR